MSVPCFVDGQGGSTDLEVSGLTLFTSPLLSSDFRAGKRMATEFGRDSFAENNFFLSVFFYRNVFLPFFFSLGFFLLVFLLLRVFIFYFFYSPPSFFCLFVFLLWNFMCDFSQAHLIFLSDFSLIFYPRFSGLFIIHSLLTRESQILCSYLSLIFSPHLISSLSLSCSRDELNLSHLSCSFFFLDHYFTF